MYKTGRRSGAGITNLVRLQNDADHVRTRQPLRLHGIGGSSSSSSSNSNSNSNSNSDEDYEPIYYPLKPESESQSAAFTPTWPLPNGGDYASSDGYRSLMAFNSQQRSAGKPAKRERMMSERSTDDSPHGMNNVDRPPMIHVKGAPGASSLGYLFGKE